MEFQYKNLKGKLEHVEVTDSEVDRQIERLRQQTPEVTVITDRPSTLGDELVLDYVAPATAWPLRAARRRIRR